MRKPAREMPRNVLYSAYFELVEMQLRQNGLYKDKPEPYKRVHNQPKRLSFRPYD